MNIATMIKQLATQGGNGTGFTVGTVTAVDKEARTVDVQPLNEDAPLLGVNLQANQGSTVGVVQIPRKDSFVMVGYVADGAAGMVILCDDIEEVQVVIKDTDTASVVVDENGVTMNGGKLGGMVKVEAAEPYRKGHKQAQAGFHELDTRTAGRRREAEGWRGKLGRKPTY